MKLNTACPIVLFVSSSGHCTLDCPYCIIDPIAKKEPSLNREDFEFILNTFKQKIFMAFSGKGDFFCGYLQRDRLLDYLLNQDVEIALDINGVHIHEFEQLSPIQLDKIRAINLTLHYRQIKEKKQQKRWTRNTKTLIEKKGNDLFLGTILSPPLIGSWEESLQFYESEIFRPSGKKITLIKDINRAFDDGHNNRLELLNRRYFHMIEHIHEEDFSKLFTAYPYVFCPAGRSYFRIWNNGDIQGCPYVAALTDCGNVKEKQFHIEPARFCCSDMRYCDCHVIQGLGKMKYGA